MKHVNKILILSVFFLASCAKDVSPTVNLPPTINKEESVIVSADKIESKVKETENKNKELADTIQQQSHIVFQQRLEIEDALAQAEKLKNKIESDQVITELETTSLIDKIKQVQTRNLFLENKNKELESIKNEQSTSLKELIEDVNDAKQKIILKEKETDSLREQNGYFRAQITDNIDDIKNLQKQLDKQKQISAKASVYRNWIIGLVVAFVLWTIVKNIIMIYSPIRMRI